MGLIQIAMTGQRDRTLQGQVMPIFRVGLSPASQSNMQYISDFN